MKSDNLRIESARKIVEAALSVSGVVNVKLVELETGLDPSEFKWCRRAMGAVLMAVLTEILNPIFSEFPSLKPPGFD